LTETPIPLFVDLDGTLVATDTFAESIWDFLKNRPWDVVRLGIWLCGGRPRAKQRLAQLGWIPDPATLPYRQDVLDFLQGEKTSGRPLILATATDRQIADRVAEHIGLFDDVMASDGTTNLKSNRKLVAIRAMCEQRGWTSFGYVGDSRADLSVWRGAAEVYAVDPPARVMRKLIRQSRITRLFKARPTRLASLKSTEREWPASAKHENVLVVGATSGIGRPLSHLLARRNCRLVLAARNQAALEQLAEELRAQYKIRVVMEPFDALDFAQHVPLVDRCREHLEGDLDGVVLCHGVLPIGEDAEAVFDVARETINVNFLSVVSLLTPIAKLMQERRNGWIAVVSSVAGDRGRQSNYVYGSSKAGLSAYLQGLRNRLFRYGVHVLTVKPGFIDTAMTKGRIDAGSPLVAKPEKVAIDIDRAIQQRRDVLYTPWFWTPIMAVVRSLPEWIFKRLKL
jgi:decaprenylphospho-beta-D-erythro-pentofuranosid-2-ulose 2-reductase